MTKRLLNTLLAALALGAAPMAQADSLPLETEESILDAPDPDALLAECGLER